MIKYIEWNIQLPVRTQSTAPESLIVVLPLIRKAMINIDTVSVRLDYSEPKDY